MLEGAIEEVEAETDASGWDFDGEGGLILVCCAPAFPPGAKRAIWRIKPGKNVYKAYRNTVTPNGWVLTKSKKRSDTSPERAIYELMRDLGITVSADMEDANDT